MFYTIFILMENVSLISLIHKYLEVNYPIKKLKDGRVFRSGIVIQSWESHDGNTYRLLINTTNKRVYAAELINKTVCEAFSMPEKESKKILVHYYLNL